MKQQCDIAILRPPVVSLLKDVQAGEEDAMEEAYAEGMEDLIYELRSLLVEAADFLNLRTSIYEFPFSERNERQQLLSKKRFEQMAQYDLLVLPDPPPVEFAFVHSSIDSHPLQRGLVAFRSNQVQMDLMNVVGSKRIALMEKGETGELKFSRLSKFFALQIPRESHDAKGIHKQNMRIASDALTYPYSPSHETKRGQFTNLVQDSDMNLEGYLTDDPQEN